MSFIKKIESGKLLKRELLLPSIEGQILSSRLSENDLFSLELYSLAKGESISSHNLLELTLYVILSGKLDVSSQKLGAKEYFLATKDTSCELFARDDTQVLIYTFKNDIELRNIESNKVNTLASQIEYVCNTVSSKIILQKKELSLTLFSFDVDEGLSTHKASGDAMVIPLEGSVFVKIDEIPYNVSEGDFIILPANIAHSLIGKTKYKMLLTVVKS
jgi:quercetin dioxygenase-like cupin family protein